jgi:hypothetical protein
MKKLISLLAILLLIFSCSKEDSNNNENPEEQNTPDLSGTWIIEYSTINCSQGNLLSDGSTSFIFNDNGSISFTDNTSDFNDFLTTNIYQLNGDNLEINLQSQQSYSFECNGVNYNTVENGSISYDCDYDEINNNFTGNFVHVFMESPTTPCTEILDCSGTITIYRQ